MTYVSKYHVIREALGKVKKEGYGICEQMGLVSPRLIKSRRLMFRSWDSFSGSVAFPVPSPEGRSHSYAFWFTSLWDGKYGRKRKLLLRHMKREAEVACRTIDEFSKIRSHRSYVERLHSELVMLTDPSNRDSGMGICAHVSGCNEYVFKDLLSCYKEARNEVYRHKRIGSVYPVSYPIYAVSNSMAYDNMPNLWDYDEEGSRYDNIYRARRHLLLDILIEACESWLHWHSK